MPYILSPMVHTSMSGMWAEGPPYSKEIIYSIEEAQPPPVNYDLHKFRAHSLTHCEAPLHTQKNGAAIEEYFSKPDYFFGKTRVVRLKGDNYKLVDSDKNIYHWEVQKEELLSELKSLPDKLLLTTDNYPTTSNSAFHDPNYVLTLSEEAAKWLLTNQNFNMYGTSWKSSDFKPGSSERPIHNLLFTQAAIFECLDLKDVPSGEYFFVGVPLPLVGASESPVCPMLFKPEEVSNIF